ncbi:Lim homeobox protein [Nesidiocoris tenuis]|uniref:Lim homeobox protein n=1 Tax=Nesidiocoris tenuis TaxID=355587 RepID=A0ABN7BFC6_9HEMI|nr:Lim homeobox protein [Nesidiocoris tenuis]
MGVYELHPLRSPGMHWQQDRQQMLAAAYDPSRDLSPNLPCQDSSNSSGCSSASSSAGSTCCKSEFTPCGDCGSPGGSETKPKPSGHPAPGEEVVCAGCNSRITDRYYLFAVDRRWHASCLQCSQCRVPLDGEMTCFARDGSIFCKKDYYRKYSSKLEGGYRPGVSVSPLTLCGQVFDLSTPIRAYLIPDSPQDLIS